MAALNAPKTESRVLAGDGREIPVPYGTTRRQALISSVTDLGDKTVWVCVWGVGEISAIQALTLDDENPTNDVTVRHYLGTTTQQPDPTLAANVADYTDNMRPVVAGHVVPLAYSVVELPADYEGTPKIDATIVGKLVYDPRLDQTLYSENPALCLADYIQSPVYGLGRPAYGVESAADRADELIGGKRRHTVGLALNDDSGTRLENAIEMARYADVRIAPHGDGRKLVSLGPASSVMDFSEAENVIPDSVEKWADFDNQPTVIRGKFTDTSSVPWRAVTGVVSKADGVDDGSQPWIDSELVFEGIHDVDELARAVSRVMLGYTHSTEMVRFRTFSMAQKLVEGDVFTLDSRLATGSYRLESIGQPDLGVFEIVGRKYSESVFDDTAAGVEPVAIPAVPRSSVAEAPTVDGITSGNGVYIQGADGTVQNRIKVELGVPASMTAFKRYNVRFRVAGSSDPWQQGLVEGFTAYLSPIVEAVEYEAQAQTETKTGATSDWVAITHTALKKDNPPPAPSSISVTVNGMGVRKITLTQPASLPNDVAGSRIVYNGGSGDIDLLDGVTDRNVIETSEMPSGNVTIRARNEDRSGQTSGWVQVSSNIAQDADGVWYDVDARIEAERVRNDGQDGTLTTHTGDINGNTSDINFESSRNDSQDGTLTTHGSDISYESGRNDSQDGTLTTHGSDINLNDYNIGVEAGRNNTQDSTLTTHTSDINANDYSIGVESGRNDGQDSTLVTHGSDINTNEGDINQVEGDVLDVENRVSPIEIQLPLTDDKAEQALLEASYKAEVFFQSYTPSTVNRNIGDMWVHTGQGNKVYGWNGAGWVDYDRLVAGAVDTIHLADNAVTVNKLNVVTLSAVSANLGIITAGEINAFSGSRQIKLTSGDFINGGSKFKVDTSGNCYAETFYIWGNLTDIIGGAPTLGWHDLGPVMEQVTSNIYDSGGA